MLKSYAAGELYVAEECRAEVHTQITQFNPLKTDNVDDILDLLVYLNKVIEQFGAYIINMGVIISQETDAIPVRSEHETCPF
jgi:hypothetical protein